MSTSYSLTINQQKALADWHNWLDANWPAFSAPIWWLNIMDRLLPSYCIFQRCITIRGKLICFIPSLCQLNPWYEALLEYRINEYY